MRPSPIRTRSSREAPYRVLADWQQDYEGNLLVILPDTYGTTNFLRHAPDWVADWTGIRIDSKDPIEGGEEAIDWWRARGQNPKEKLAIFSDGLDVGRHPDASTSISTAACASAMAGARCSPTTSAASRREGALDPISIVCKVISAERPPGGEDLRQPDQGDGPARRGGALQARLPRGRAGGAAGAGLIEQPRHGAPHMQQAMRVDLNCDMGEGFGPWPMGDDAAMLDIVTSANIACGFHAGDPDIMARTAALAKEKGVAIGAHPGFNDLWGFGRRQIPVDSYARVERMVAYQIGAMQGVAALCRARVTYVKAHGSLNNMANED